MRYLVETDWAVNYLRGDDATAARLSALRPDGLGLSMVSLAELMTGVHRSVKPEATRAVLDGFLTGVTLVGLDEETADLYGKENARLRKVGLLIDKFDLLIGVTALRHKLVLLTNNTDHFDRIEGLTLESLPKK